MTGHRSGDPRWLPTADRFYRAALFVFPNKFRIEYGPWMRQAFLDRCREIDTSERSAFQVLAFELVPDLITTFGREQMQAGIGDVFPRQVVILGMFCLVLVALLFKDAITPPILDQVVTTRNWMSGSREARQTEAREAMIRASAAELSKAPDATSKALGAWLYSAIAVRKENPYWAPDHQNEAIFRHPREDASVENDASKSLVEVVLRESTDEHVIVRALESCRPAAGCDRSHAIRILTGLYPDNGYGWSLAFDAAAEQENPAAMRNALASLAKAARYEAFEGATMSKLLAATPLGDSNTPEWQELLRATAGRKRLLGGYVFGRLSRYCARNTTRDEASTTAEAIRTDCLAAFRLMAGSTKLAASMAGHRGVATFADDEVVRTAAADDLRTLYWLSGAQFDRGSKGSLTLGESWAAEGDPRKAHESWTAAFREGKGEIPSLRLLFAAEGVPLSPPATYKVPATWSNFEGVR